MPMTHRKTQKEDKINYCDAKKCKVKMKQNPKKKQKKIQEKIPMTPKERQKKC